jgi:hypothetical protein
MRFIDSNPSVTFNSVRIFYGGSITATPCPLIIVDNRYLIAGAGIKILIEDKKIHSVIKLHQESNISGKTPYIHGRHFHASGIPASCFQKTFCIP